MKQHLCKLMQVMLLAGLAAVSSSCMFMPKEEEKISDKGNLVWSDEFDYTGVPNTTKWKYQTGAGGWGNNELQNYLDNTTEAKTAVVEDGMLHIKAIKENGTWKSARLNSKASIKYGYIEARMKITDTLGTWPAFWMMPTTSVYGAWPASGEIDIMENAPATAGKNVIFSSLHAQGHYAGSPKKIGSKKIDNLGDDFHTVGIKWTEDCITVYYDDVEQNSYSNDGTGYVNWPYDQEFYVILNLAIGGNLGGTPAAATLPATGTEFIVDYVRMYQ